MGVASLELVNTDNDTAIWLVKSGDKILGPFTREEIKTKLYEKEIVVIDEVITPLHRWRYIRDEPVFAVVVEDIRKSSLGAREDTELGTFANTQSMATDLTEEIDPTQTPVPNTPGSSHPSMIQDAVIVEESKTSGGTRPKPPLAQAVKSYGSGNDQRVQRDINRGSRAVWFLTAVALVALGFLFVNVQSQKEAKQGGTNINTLLIEATDSRQLGDFKKTLNIYRRLYDIGYREPRILIDMAALILKRGDYTVSPTRLLESEELNSINPTDRENRKFLTTVQGLAHLTEAAQTRNAGSFEKARGLFRAALELDPNYVPALFNKAMTDFLDPSFDVKVHRDRLIADFQKVIQQPDDFDPSARNASNLMVAMVMLKMREASWARDAAAYLEDRRTKMIQYWQEAAFLRAYAFAIASDPASAQSTLRFALLADPYVTDDHVVDPLLYIAPLEWTNASPEGSLLLKFCQETTVAANKGVGILKQTIDPIVKAVVPFCLYKAGLKQEEARRQMLELERQNIDDPQFKGLAAYMEIPVNEEGALARVKSIPAGLTENQKWDLLKALRGRVCDAKDFECQIQAFGPAATLTPKGASLYITAARGQLAKAMVKEEAGNRAEAAELRNSAMLKIRQIEELSPHYIPLLKLKWELEHQ